MRGVLLLILGGLLAGVAGCHSDSQTQPATKPAPAAPVASGLPQGVWQLDYYPDSLLMAKDIYAYSNWTAPYAANLRFAGDSCELVGWHESWWTKPELVGVGYYRLGSDGQYYEVEFFADGLQFRELRVDENGRKDSTEWYPYHRVAQVLTPAALKKRVAQQLFAGRYRVLQSDLKADSIVTLTADFRVAGLRGVSGYDVVTAMDWDFLLPNAFEWRNRRGKAVGQYSFQFAGDTLRLRAFEMHPEDEDVPSGVEVTTTKAEFLKLPPTRAAQPVAGPE